MRKIEIYRMASGKQPFVEWLNAQDGGAKRKILAYVQRVADGASRSNLKPVGDGVFEIKIDYGPGFRVYFGQVGSVMILLLVGGDKSTQPRDIAQAKVFWRSYVSK